MAEAASYGQPSGGHTWWTKTIFAIALLAVVALPVAALGYRVGLWTVPAAFLVMGAGVLLAAVGLVTGILGIVLVHRQRRRAARPAVYLAVVLSLLVLGLMAVQYLAAARVPPIHDISTDVVEPPGFDQVVAVRPEGSNSLSYDAEALAAVQREAYPWVETLTTERAPADALSRAAEVLEDMGLEIVNVDPAAGRVEATATTFWFGFKDDVVVRVRSAAGGSRVDVRSVSRIGVSDLGKNAQRIGQFLDAYRAGG